jgi:hypothetical protein
MTTSTLTLAIAVALVATPASFAQQPPEAPSTRPPSASVTVSDADIETFANIYADLRQTASRFQAEMESARTEEQALEIRARAQSESVAKVEQHGWTPEKFNSVSEAIDRDPALTEKAVNLIEAK